MAGDRYVIKRNGTRVPYDEEKIVNALTKAFKSCGYFELPEGVKIYALFLAEHSGSNTVESIQDAVQRAIMEKGYYDVAAEYIKYRDAHARLRFIKERVDYMDNGFVNSNSSVATLSETDPNANVALKNVATLEPEVYKPTNREIQRYRMTKKLKELFPEVANQYEIDINNHIIYPHDEASTPVLKNYCEAVSLYPLLEKGCGNMDGVTPGPPTNYHAFCGQLVNLTHSLAGQCKGAVAFGEFFNYIDYFCAKDFGPNYHKEFNEISSIRPKRTIIEAIHQGYQQIVCGWNQPAGNRGGQSPFVNISYYDENYWKALFDKFMFPDGSKPVWERVSWLQKDFMQWFNNERLKALYTMPVETVALLHDGTDVIDKDWKDFTNEMWAKGHSFFVYLSDSADSLASCCFSPETKVLWKSSTKGVQCTSLKELEDLKWDPDKKNLRIFHNGFWIKGKPIKVKNTDFYKVTTANHKVFYMTNNHINITIDGEKETSSLKVGDYLMFNTKVLNAVPELDEHLTYEMGFVVGAFLGDGSFGSEINGTIYDINFSQNKDKVNTCIANINKCAEQLNIDNRAKLNTVYNNVYPVRISSKELVSFIQKWTLWTRGTYANTKKLNLDCLLQSVDFRRGILDGWYNTDGGNSNRCYTTSTELKDCMEILITSLGMNSIIDYSDRTDEVVSIREKEYNRNYPLWCVRWYEPSNKTSIDNVYKWKNNSQYFKITDITHIGELPDEQYSYCIESYDSENPYFTLPSGLVTHNCRLKNKIDSNVFSFTNGLTGVMTGSCNVITLNLNRIIQDFYRQINQYTSLTPVPHNDGTINLLSYSNWEVDFKSYLINILERVYKYHIAYKTMLYDIEKKGMLEASNAGYIKMDKLYSTIGINGHNEAAEFLGLTCNYNEDYKKFISFITGIISEQNQLHSTPLFKFNTELVPAESLSSKNYNWDKKDGYIVPKDRNLYNSYFYLADDKEISVLDKFRLHGKEFTSLLDGGVGCHINLEEHLSKEQYSKLMDFAIANGTTYYTFNVPNSQCSNPECKYIIKGPVATCPKCGSPMDWWTRVIGFLRPIKNFDFARFIEAGKRVYTKKDEVC